MSDDITPTPEADPVADLLAPSGGPESSLRDTLRRRTVRLLRRRILIRRVALAAALAAAFLLGLLVPRPTSPAPSPPEPGPQTNAPAPPPPPAVEKRQEPAAPPSAVVLEWRAFDDLNAELYRQAGQRYLQDSDPQSAVRCYRQSLNAGGPNALTVSADDDWLLIALKDARQREKHDAKHID